MSFCLLLKVAFLESAPNKPNYFKILGTELAKFPCLNCGLYGGSRPKAPFLCAAGLSFASQVQSKTQLEPKSLANSSGSFPIVAGSAVRSDVIEKAELYKGAALIELNLNLLF